MEEKFDYFIRRTEEDLKDIKTDMKKLIGLRWMLLGSAAAIATLFSIVVTLATLALRAI